MLPSPSSTLFRLRKLKTWVADGTVAELLVRHTSDVMWHIRCALNTFLKLCLSWRMFEHRSAFDDFCEDIYTPTSFTHDDVHTCSCCNCDCLLLCYGNRLIMNTRRGAFSFRTLLNETAKLSFISKKPFTFRSSRLSLYLFTNHSFFGRIMYNCTI